MFLINSRHSWFCASIETKSLCYPFFQSYGINLPSSLSMVLSKPWVFSTCSPVSVYSTVIFFSLFSELLKKIFMVVSWILFFQRKKIVTIKSYPSKIVFTYFLGAVWLCVDKRCAETFELSAIMIITWFEATHVSILTSDIFKISFEISLGNYRTFCYRTSSSTQPKWKILDEMFLSCRWIT